MTTPDVFHTGSIMAPDTTQIQAKLPFPDLSQTIQQRQSQMTAGFDFTTFKTTADNYQQE